ncbi:MAG: GNAT family N-acetyltransferase [Candidatus Coproplasma sp.]
MRELSKGERRGLYPLYENSSDTLVDSCLQGYCGRVFTGGGLNGLDLGGGLGGLDLGGLSNGKSLPDGKNLSAAVACGDFIYLGGAADGKLLKEVLSCCPVPKFLVPMSEDWCGCIGDICGANAKRTSRFATKRNTVFDLDRLKAYPAPEGFEIERVDAQIYGAFAAQDWSKDFTANFKDFEEYSRLGVGYAATFEGRAVAGASSYSVCDDAIEVQIVTHPSFRKRGLAHACAAKLIVGCLERGLYPNWDAEHAASLRIAQSLGYEFLREYTAFILSDRE